MFSAFEFLIVFNSVAIVFIVSYLIFAFSEIDSKIFDLKEHLDLTMEIIDKNLFDPKTGHADINKSLYEKVEDLETRFNNFYNCVREDMTGELTLENKTAKRKNINSRDIRYESFEIPGLEKKEIK